jgi:predicted N-acetyltransferase YhbS
MTDFELRRIEEHEINAFASCQASAFGGRYTPDKLESLAEDLRLDRSLAVFDGGDLVATASSYAVLMTLPGLVRCEVTAVTDVSVAPTHRRRGLLTSMMRRQLDDVRSSNEAVAVLFASEGAIYGRYGYGPATFGARYVVDKRRARLLTPFAMPCGPGSGGGPARSGSSSWLRQPRRSPRSTEHMCRPELVSSTARTGSGRSCWGTRTERARTRDTVSLRVMSKLVASTAMPSIASQRWTLLTTGAAPCSWRSCAR